MGILSRLKGEGSLILHHDYRAGSFRDLSGNGNDGAPDSAVVLARDGVIMGPGNEITVSDNATFDITAITYAICIPCGFTSPLLANNCLQKGVGASCSFNFYTNVNGTRITWYDGVSYRNLDTPLIGAKTIIITLASGSAYDAYVDGVYVGSGGGTSVVVDRDASDIRPCGAGAAFSIQEENRVASVAMFNRALTSTEAAELHTEMLQATDRRPIIVRDDDSGDRVMTSIGNSVRETVSSVSSGYLPGTPFKVQSGSWDIKTEDIGGVPAKVIECASSGIICADWGDFGEDPGEASYGTWEYWTYKGDFVTTRIGLSLQDCGAYEDATNSGYGLAFNSAERVRLSRIISGAIVNIINTGADVLPIDQWVHVKTTRSPAGEFNVYIDGSLVGTVTDTTHTTGRYVSVDLFTGSKIALVDARGKPLFRKWRSVV